MGRWLQGRKENLVDQTLITKEESWRKIER